MTTRTAAPAGSPCWTDLWTSDIAGSRAFYPALFGWEAGEPSPEFGGYFMFTRDGIPVAGAMGDMGDLSADNSWKIYLATGDIDATVAAVEAGGGRITGPPMPVADLGVQAVFTDPSGATLGAWQAGTFPGFTVLEEHGAPAWFELVTRDDAGAVSFYRSAFPLEAEVTADSDEFRYTTLLDPADGHGVGGIMDAGSVLQEGEPAHWLTYWEVDDVDARASAVSSLGGSVLSHPSDTPFGRMATVADPSGARFKLRTATG